MESFLRPITKTICDSTEPRERLKTGHGETRPRPMRLHATAITKRPPQEKKVGSSGKPHPEAQQEGASTHVEQPTLRTDKANNQFTCNELSRILKRYPLTTPFIFGSALIVRRRTKRHLRPRTAAAAALEWRRWRIQFHPFASTSHAISSSCFIRKFWEMST